MPRETLEKMRKWVESEQEKAKRPFAEPFILTSLVYCAYKVAEQAQAEEALALLHATKKEEWQVPTYDVVSPFGALFIIGRALKKC